MSNDALGFWIEGGDRYSQALEKERNDRLAELQQQLAAAESVEERDRIEADVRDVQETYKKKIAEMPWLLF